MVSFNTSIIFNYRLLIINFFGTIYGYYWYKWQLAVTEPIFYIFVPDSPTASLFFVLRLSRWLLGKHFKLNGSVGINYTC